MNNNPKVTIVTVTYNVEDCLEETINNIINQTYPNIEYIIIDGGSTDKTIDIIKKYEDSIAYWCSEKDEGIYHAMNKAIDIANGKWINFMNAGDTFCNLHTIEDVIKHDDKKHDFLAGDVYEIDLLKDEKKYWHSPGIENIFERTFCYHQALFSKTSLMKKFHFNTEYKVIADYEFILKAYLHNYKFKFINFAVANYVLGGFSANNMLLLKIEELFLKSKYLKNIEDIFKLNSSKQLIALDKTNHKKKIDIKNNLQIIFDAMEEMDLSNKKFILYGFGNLGKIIYGLYKQQTIKIVDNNYESFKDFKVYPLEELKNTEFDFILISVIGQEENITNNLISTYKIPNEKILYIKF